MATRSHIGKLLPNGKVKYIYCHFDGDLDNNGKLLVENYNTSDKVDQLLDLGNLSYLAPQIGEKRDFNSTYNSEFCLAYGRDRGELNQEASTTILENFTPEFIDYVYLYTDEGWKWNNSKGGEFKSVLPFLEKK